MNATGDAELHGGPNFEIASGSATDEAATEANGRRASLLDNLNNGNRDLATSGLDSKNNIGNGGMLSHDPSTRSIRNKKVIVDNEESSN